MNCNVIIYDLPVEIRIRGEEGTDTFLVVCYRKSLCILYEGWNPLDGWAGICFSIKKFDSYCIPRTKYVRGILWFSRRYAASADISSFSG